MYKGHRERAIYCTPGVKVLRPQIVLPNLVASNFDETETKISSLLMLTAIKYHQGNGKKKKKQHKSCKKKKIWL
jgi:succinate dehydrogenase hydrophobic anchor subunit